jgi:hypothetical protein
VHMVGEEAPEIVQVGLGLPDGADGHHAAIAASSKCPSVGHLVGISASSLFERRPAARLATDAQHQTAGWCAVTGPA